MSAFMGLGAVYGGIALLRDAEGFGLDEAWLDGSPFPDYRVPGLFLLVAIGGGMLATAAAALRRSPRAPLAAVAMGALLAAWLAIESAIVGFQGSQQVALLVVCGGSAAILLAAGATARARTGTASGSRRRPR